MIVHQPVAKREECYAELIRMKRRELLAGMACAASAAQGGDVKPEAETLYIPQAHRVEDLALLHETMDEFPFVDLVTTSPTLRITHIPVWLDRSTGPYGVLYGHVAKHNPQAAALDGRNHAVLVFHGPHAYISAGWYENATSVPTWNFAAVHATGKPQPITDEEPLHALLATLIERSENKYAKTSYDFNALPKSYASSMMQNIVGFRMPIDLLEGKYKLGQERSEKDRASIVSHLRSPSGERSIGDFTTAFYRRQRKPI